MKLVGKMQRDAGPHGMEMGRKAKALLQTEDEERREQLSGSRRTPD